MVVVVMEGKPSPHLKKVLKSYQLAAANTMSGPSPHLSSRYESGCGNSSLRNSVGSSVNSGSTHNAMINNGKILSSSPYTMSKSGGIHLSNGMQIQGIPGNLLQHQLTQQTGKQLSSLSIPIPLENIKKDVITPVNLLLSRPCPPESPPQSHNRGSSIVPIRRSSGGAVEMNGRAPGAPADGQVKNALISRSKSSPAGSGLSHINGNSSSNPSLNNLPHSNSTHKSSHSPPSSSSCEALNTSLKMQSVGSYGSGSVNNIKFSPNSSFKHPESSSANALRSPSSTGIGGTATTTKSTTNATGTGSSTATIALIRERDSSLPAPTPGPPTQLPPPILSAPDRSFTQKKETILEGERISCFDIGGEMRLCFPQILKIVLSSRFSLHQINTVCDELQICCACCSAEQLEVLKHCGIIPLNAPSCGLITKTDAERLVNSLLHRNPPKAALPSHLLSPKDTKPNFRVIHKCFGYAIGIVTLAAYDKPDALCIECVTCHGLFSPPRFVAHSHNRTENRTCHWGFDTANWRHYLMLTEDHEDSSRWESALVEFKSRFEHKRKEVRSSPVKDLDDHLLIKKSRCEPPVVSPSFNRSPNPSLSTKLPLFIQYPKTEQSGLISSDLEQVKQMLLYKLGPDGANVNSILDTMAKKISSLEQICQNQEKIIKEVSQAKTGAGTELQSKVNTMEAELHSLKKQLLRRHESNQNKIKSEEM